MMDTEALRETLRAEDIANEFNDIETDTNDVIPTQHSQLEGSNTPVQASQQLSIPETTQDRQKKGRKRKQAA